MTTDDDMREIEAALEDFEDFHRELWSARAMAVAGEGDARRCREAREKLLALIRQKLDVAQKPATSPQPAADVAQNDADHEQAVEAWRAKAESSDLTSGEIDEALRLMRARPVADKAAGELLRAAKAAYPWVYGHQVEADDLWDAIEAAERAGVR